VKNWKLDAARKSLGVKNLKNGKCRCEFRAKIDFTPDELDKPLDLLAWMAMSLKTEVKRKADELRLILASETKKEYLEGKQDG